MKQTFMVAGNLSIAAFKLPNGVSGDHSIAGSADVKCAKTKEFKHL